MLYDDFLKQIITLGVNTCRYPPTFSTSQALWCHPGFTRWPAYIGMVLVVCILYFILYLYVVLDVCAGGDGRHVVRRKLLQLFGLKRVGTSLSPDGFCPLRPHSPNRGLPQYGGGNA